MNIFIIKDIFAENKLFLKNKTIPERRVCRYFTGFIKQRKSSGAYL